MHRKRSDRGLSQSVIPTPLSQSSVEESMNKTRNQQGHFAFMFVSLLISLLQLSTISWTSAQGPPRSSSCVLAFTPSISISHRYRGQSPLYSRDTASSKTRTTTTTLGATRREILEVGLLSVTAAAAAAVNPRRVNAFENKISTKYDDRPKRRGTKPKDLGVATRYDLGGQDYTGLKPCGPAPNCFVSTDNVEDDPDHVIPAWKWPSSRLSSSDDAWDELVYVVSKYQPGQNNVDGGGFQIVTNDLQKKYLYVQFESLKNGYIDDFEAWIPSSSASNAVEIRSSSRLGYLDFGVNAKRINAIATKLREKGWDAEGVDYKTHQGYVLENQLDR